MNERLIKSLLFVLTAFFWLLAASHFFGELGKDKAGAARLSMSAWSSRLMPLDGEPAFWYGYTLLSANGENRDNGITLKSIRAFEKSLRRNMFDYNAHYYLAKALLLYEFPRSPYFRRAGECFKRAAFLRGGKNPAVAADTLVLLLSRWPFLKDDEKRFAGDLMGKSVDRLGKENVDRVLEAWRLYSRDIEFFQGLLKSNPKYYLTAAQELSRLEIHLELRQQFLSRYEVHRWAWAKNRYRQERENPAPLPDRLMALYRGVKIDGYYKLVNNSDFDENSFLDIKRKLALDILKRLFSHEDTRSQPEKIKQKVHYVMEYINHSTSRRQVEILNECLKKNKFFDTPDFKVFWIKQQIQTRMGNGNAVCADIERFRRSLAFVKKEHMTGYIDILLLLSDTYFDNRLLIRALSVLEEIEKISPGLPGVDWRKKKIAAIIGGGDPKDENGNITAGPLIELHSLNTRKTVYLLDNNKIKITIRDELKEKLKDRRLLQVFIDRRIYFETYLSQVDDEGVVIKAPRKTGKYDVLVRIK